MIALLDCHYPGDDFSDRKKNPHRDDEVKLGRAWNKDLFWSLDQCGVDATRVQIDDQNPRNPWGAFDLKVDGCIKAKATMAIETHCNYTPEHNGHGRIVMVGATDDDSCRLGMSIANKWETITGHTVPLVRVPDPRWPHNPKLFRLLAEHGISFVLPELGALNHKDRAGNLDILADLENRGQTYWRMLEAVTAAAVEVLT